MLRLFPAAVDRRLDEDISSSFRREEDIDSVSGDHSSDDSSVSDCESVISGNQIVEHTCRIQLVRLDESDKLRGVIEQKFVSRASVDGVNAQVQYIHRNMFNASAISIARLRSFQIFTKAVEKKNGGDANIKYAWFGASKDEIDNIILHGFGHDNIQNNGVVLSADHSPLQSMESAIPDDDGIKHILLCRVILGKTELVNPFSTQCHPSSEDFQSGVDNFASSKKFIVWSSQMNTHILPEFVVSFKTLSTMNNESIQGPQLDGVHLRKPVSPWIPIPDLIAALSKLLPPKAMKEITQYRRSYIEHKISRRDMIQGIREFTGDRLLLMVLKDFTEQRRHGLGGKSESRSDVFK